MKPKKDKFLLLSLQEDKAKHLAKVISSKTSRKILDFLADNPSTTATKIAQVLQIPLNTTTYNLQQLVKGGLVVSEEFHYSEKGREVDHYSLANKYIIIAPKETEGWKEKLGGILPIGGILLAAAAGFQLFKQSLGGVAMKAAPIVQPVVQAIEEEPVFAAEKAADVVSTGITSGAGPMAAEEAVEMAAPRAAEIAATAGTPWLAITLWAIIVILFILSVYFLIRKLGKK